MSNDIRDESCVVAVIGNNGREWESITEWQDLPPLEAFRLFETIEGDYRSLLDDRHCYEAIEVQLWDDDYKGDALLVTLINLNK